jgi:Sel1 repeat
MNWSYVGIAALLPLVVALSLSLVAGAFQAVRLTLQGLASRTAYSRMFKAMAVVFPLSFLAVTIWNGRYTWRSLLGVALQQPAHQRTMGLLRAGGGGCFKKNTAKGVYWFKKSAEGGDAEGQFLLAKALLQGKGLTPDPEGALHWAQAAADQGQPDAMVFTGDQLRSSDSEAANRWYRRALPIYRQRIQARDADACLAYGQMLWNGKGLEVDRIEGLAWMYASRRMGLDPFGSLIVQLSEGSLSGPQRIESARRAEAILESLPRRGV